MLASLALWYVILSSATCCNWDLLKPIVKDKQLRNEECQGKRRGCKSWSWGVTTRNSLGPSYTIFFSLYYRIHLFLSSDLNVTISPIMKVKVSNRLWKKKSQPIVVTFFSPNCSMPKMEESQVLKMDLKKVIGICKLPSSSDFPF